MVVLSCTEIMTLDSFTMVCDWIISYHFLDLEAANKGGGINTDVRLVP